jgi:N-dimethylarginine dimethylaminohydrolase
MNKKNSKNEWSQLKKVVVGIAAEAKLPEIDLSMRTINYADKSDISDIVIGNYPKNVIEEASDDLEIFVNFLQSQHIEVVRPEKNNPKYYNYCPRDSVFIHDNLTLATPMPIKARNNEWKSLEKYLSNPISVECSYYKDLYNLNCLGDKDTLALTEYSPAFDAANVIRANDDILFLISNTGNKQGAKLLQELLGNDVRVHTLEGVYSYIHIDSTIAFLREGLMLLNPERIKNKDVLPKPFCNWDVIWCPEPIDIGYYMNYNNASKWINMNLFSINPNLVVLEENQHNLRKELERYNIECAMLPMRHQRTLGGGFHCVTLDLERE